MSLVIGGGPSVTDYSPESLIELAYCDFTFAVNHTCFDFPSDIIVSLDFDFIKEHRDKLKEMAIPIVTRVWDGNKGLGLDLIEIPNDVGANYKFSGMAAAKLSDTLISKSDRFSYVIGLDGGKGRYKGHKGKGQIDYTTAEDHHYFNLGLTRTINLGMVSSKIGCWPKQSKLPNPRRVAFLPNMRAEAIAWIRKNATGILK